MTGAIYDDNPAYPVARRITRGPTEKEAEAIADLIRAVRGAAIDIARERRLEDRERRGA